MGTLFIVSTPIGNLEDITVRAIKMLSSVDIIACEDTRRTGLLLAELRKRYASFSSSLGTRTQKLLRYDDRFEEQKVPFLIDRLQQGENLALLSDAGTPLISDPGYVLVGEALKREIPVVSIPGPSAILAALVCSGLPVDSFLFLGYPPEKQAHRIKRFKDLRTQGVIASTAILYCAPHKLKRVLEDLASVWGTIDIVLARELTKIHESVWRGSIREAVRIADTMIGEIVLLFALNQDANS
jgi:16S rRNA (cytidine1402-2'-O)-methyltransferase